MLNHNIKKEYPPNYQLLVDTFNPPSTTVFVYGDTIYNPSGDKIPPDVVVHEEVHMRQQREYASPDMWYALYIHDKDFRLTQEVEAYAVQYQFLKRNGLPANGLKEALHEFARALANDYKTGIDTYKAKTLIRYRSMV